MPTATAPRLTTERRARPERRRDAKHELGRLRALVRAIATVNLEFREATDERVTLLEAQVDELTARVAALEAR